MDDKLFIVFYQHPEGGYRWVENVRLPDTLSTPEALEKVFQNMQGEIWSPNGEKREIIKALGLTHTSMMVGDIVKEIGGDSWRCESSGWSEFKGCVLPLTKS